MAFPYTENIRISLKLPFCIQKRTQKSDLFNFGFSLHPVGIRIAFVEPPLFDAIVCSDGDHFPLPQTLTIIVCRNE